MDANLRADPQFRAFVAGSAVTLAENYTPEQIRSIKPQWPHETAPTIKQLLREIGRYVNRRPRLAPEENQNGTHSKYPAKKLCPKP
jgi:hypothetical protein